MSQIFHKWGRVSIPLMWNSTWHTSGRICVREGVLLDLGLGCHRVLPYVLQLINSMLLSNIRNAHGKNLKWFLFPVVYADIISNSVYHLRDNISYRSPRQQKSSGYNNNTQQHWVRFLSLMLSPPRHLLASVHQDVEVDVARRVYVILCRLAVLEINKWGKL